jgi:hypothetical protein
VVRLLLPRVARDVGRPETRLERHLRLAEQMPDGRVKPARPLPHARAAGGLRVWKSVSCW